MKTNLLFLLFVLGNALPLNIKDDQQDITSAFISAYFEGTFRNPKDWNKTIDAQFQIKIDTDWGQEALTVNYWNSTLLSKNNVYLEIRTESNGRNCYNFNEPCVIPFDGNQKYFTFTLVNEYPWFYFRLFQLNKADSVWFTLPNAYNGCTNELPPLTEIVDYADNQADPKLYSYCACAGDYKPDPLLGCPVSPLQSHT